MQFVSQGAASLSCCGGLKGPKQSSTRKLYHQDVIFIANHTDINREYIIYRHQQKWHYLSDFVNQSFPLLIHFKPSVVYTVIHCCNTVCLDFAKHLLFKYQFFTGSRVWKKALKVNCFFCHRWQLNSAWIHSRYVGTTYCMCWWKNDIEENKCPFQQHAQHLFHVGNINGFLKQWLHAVLQNYQKAMVWQNLI